MTKLLLNEAAKKTLQYTFLTPQDTSEIEKSKDLDILRLEHFYIQMFSRKNIHVFVSSFS